MLTACMWGKREIKYSNVFALSNWVNEIVVLWNRKIRLQYISIYVSIYSKEFWPAYLKFERPINIKKVESLSWKERGHSKKCIFACSPSVWGDLGWGRRLCHNAEEGQNLSSAQPSWEGVGMIFTVYDHSDTCILWVL